MVVFYCLLGVYLIGIVVHAVVRSNKVEPEYSRTQYDNFRALCVRKGFLPFDYVEKGVANSLIHVGDTVDVLVEKVDYFQKMDKNGNILFLDTNTGYVVLETEKEIKIIDKI